MKVHKYDEYYWDSWPELKTVSVCGRENVHMEGRWTKVTCARCLRMRKKRASEK